MLAILFGHGLLDFNVELVDDLVEVVVVDGILCVVDVVDVVGEAVGCCKLD